MGEYADRWKATKTKFEAATKVKKPSDKVMGFFRKGTGIEDALKKVEAAGDAFSAKGGQTEANVKKFEVAVGEYNKAKAAYLQVLTSALTKEPKGVDSDTYAKGVKMLQTELEALSAVLNAKLLNLQGALKGQSVTDLMGKNLMTLAKGACVKAKAFIAKVKVSGSAKEFNDGVQDACRDITQQIGNINKLTAKGYVFPKAQPDNLFKILAAWGNDGRRVKPDAPKPIVLREVGALEQAVKGVEAWAS